MEWIQPLGHDLADGRFRKKLKPREHPYWSMLCRNRGIGVLVESPRRLVWIAHATKKFRRRTSQKWLGITDDFHPADGNTYLTCSQAVERAWQWFRTLSSSEYEDAKPAGLVVQLNYSPVGDTFTVGHAIKDYLEWKRLSWRFSSYYGAISMANNYILPNIGFCAVADLSAEEIKKVVQITLETPPSRLDKKRGVRKVVEKLTADELRKRRDVVNNVTGLLRAALLFAWENGKTDNERCWRVIKPIRNVQNARLVHLNRTECRRLLQQCPPDLALLVRAALYTGCRSEELVRLKAEDVGRDGHSLYVAPGKNYKSRHVFLPDEGIAFFRKHAKGKRPKDLLFRRADGKIWGRRHSVLLKRCVRAAGLDDKITFHGLRHTYASQLVQAGAPLIVVSQQLGHADISMVSAVYGHLAPQIREAEVRQRFTSIEGKAPGRAELGAPKISKTAKPGQKRGRQCYARLSDLKSRKATK